MVLTKRAVLQFLFTILCTITGLNALPRNHPSLGILNELIGTDSKSPLIVVVDSNNQAKTLDDEPERGDSQGHSKSCPNHPDHVKNPAHHSKKISNKDYKAALYELLRTSKKLLEQQERSSDRIGGRSSDRFNGKNDSCAPDKSEQLAEQCSQSGDNSCDNNNGEDEC